MAAIVWAAVVTLMRIASRLPFPFAVLALIARAADEVGTALFAALRTCLSFRVCRRRKARCEPSCASGGHSRSINSCRVRCWVPRLSLRAGIHSGSHLSGACGVSLSRMF